ncbi:hypothetical protein GYMLUDRAFT_237855 [Collybiopsis luxurians FD-317 M1]|nr:hypothetical protein GYMLUDRAFT_237855 [Collybiopsis luxurians FD-317 M1]
MARLMRLWDLRRIKELQEQMKTKGADLERTLTRLKIQPPEDDGQSTRVRSETLKDQHERWPSSGSSNVPSFAAPRSSRTSIVSAMNPSTILANAANATIGGGHFDTAGNNMYRNTVCPKRFNIPMMWTWGLFNDLKSEACNIIFVYPAANPLSKNNRSNTLREYRIIADIRHFPITNPAETIAGELAPSPGYALEIPESCCASQKPSLASSTYTISRLVHEIRFSIFLSCLFENSAPSQNSSRMTHPLTTRRAGLSNYRRLRLPSPLKPRGVPQDLVQDHVHNVLAMGGRLLAKIIHEILKYSVERDLTTLLQFLAYICKMEKTVQQGILSTYHPPY